MKSHFAASIVMSPRRLRDTEKQLKRTRITCPHTSHKKLLAAPSFHTLAESHSRENSRDRTRAFGTRNQNVDPGFPTFWLTTCRIGSCQKSRTIGIGLEGRLRLITRGKKGCSARFSRAHDRAIPLFRTDPSIFESRRTAWLVRSHLLLEWNGPAEAPAWTCLECQLSDHSRDAKALRDRFLQKLNLDFDSPEAPPDKIAVETQWPGVAGIYELKAKLERNVILSLRLPELDFIAQLAFAPGLALFP
jgi:hypothetical protein